MDFNYYNNFLFSLLMWSPTTNIYFKNENAAILYFCVSFLWKNFSLSMDLWGREGRQKWKETQTSCSLTELKSWPSTLFLKHLFSSQPSPSKQQAPRRKRLWPCNLLLLSWGQQPQIRKKLKKPMWPHMVAVDSWFLKTLVNEKCLRNLKYFEEQSVVFCTCTTYSYCNAYSSVSYACVASAREVGVTTSTGETKLHLLIFNHHTVNFLLRQTKCIRCTDTAETASVSICCQALKANLAEKRARSFFSKLSNSHNFFTIFLFKTKSKCPFQCIPH